ncbi:DNA translocase FtsK, partial [Microvirga soli]|uniref:DNA translocase FtsK n=1 Tax=Microvirga soli TaxID=1854496 RepID=UPI002483522A
MHFNRRPPSSAAHGYGSLAQDQDYKNELDNNEPGASGGLVTGGRTGHRAGEGPSGGTRAQANPGHVSSPSGARTPNTIAPKAGQGRGANGAPRGEVWEQSFSMSPEVRFTRTPERVLKERRMKGAALPSDDSVEEQARQIAAARMDDPAPAVQERLQALRSKAASQETGADNPRIFNRAPAPERGPITRAAAPARTVEASLRRAPVTEPARTQKAEQPMPPAKSSPVAPAPYELQTVQQSYSFMWQPGTYLLDPSLQPASAMPAQAKSHESAQPARKVAPAVKAAPPARAVAPVPSRVPLPAQPETALWDDEEEYVEEALSDDDFDVEDIVEEAPRRAAVVTQPRVSHMPAAPVPANDSFRRDNYASVSVGVAAPVNASFDYELPALDLLAEPKVWNSAEVPVEVLQENAATLENVLWDFNVKGEIINVRPGPVVTLYELEPAPGTKSSRVISLA